MFLPFILAAIQGVSPLPGSFNLAAQSGSNPTSIQKTPIQEYYVNFPEMGAIGYCEGKKKGLSHEEAQAAAMKLARGPGQPKEWITDEQGQTYSKPMLRMVQLTIQQCPQFFEIIPIDP